LGLFFFCLRGQLGTIYSFVCSRALKESVVIGSFIGFRGLFIFLGYRGAYSLFLFRGILRRKLRAQKLRSFSYYSLLFLVLFFLNLIGVIGLLPRITPHPVFVVSLVGGGWRAAVLKKK